MSKQDCRSQHQLELPKLLFRVLLAAALLLNIAAMLSSLAEQTHPMEVSSREPKALPLQSWFCL